jgi:hypothetical protein
MICDFPVSKGDFTHVIASCAHCRRGEIKDIRTDERQSFNDKLQGENVRESVKTHGGGVVKDFAKQGAKALLQQAGRGSKRRQGQRSNLSTTKRLKLCSHIAVPRHTKWITKDESNHDDESSYDEESDSEPPQTCDDIY